MVQRTLSSDLLGKAGHPARIEGWIHRRRQLATISFLILRDRSGLAQVVVSDEATRQQLDGLGEETVVRVDGIVSANARAPGGVELTSPSITELSAPAATPPVELWRPTLSSGLPTLLDYAPITWRHPVQQAIWRLAAASLQGFRGALDGQDFTEVHTPKLVAGSTESGANVFTVDYFGRPAYLAQSPQFYKQMAMCAGFERVFEIGPVFRANPHVTARHDTEFVSVDVEMSWIESHEEVMAVEERWLRHVVATVEGDHGHEIARLFGRVVTVPDVPFPRVTMADAGRMLAKVAIGPQGPAPPKVTSTPRAIWLLAEHVAAEHGHELVFVTEYPAAVRPFYHMRLEDGSDLTRGFDLLWNGLEVTTGAQREHRHDRLSAQAGANPSRIEVIQPYLDFFRHGCPPHGGFGLGLSRVLMCLLGSADVREVTFLHRDRNRLSP